MSPSLEYNPEDEHSTNGDSGNNGGGNAEDMNNENIDNTSDLDVGELRRNIRTMFQSHLDELKQDASLDANKVYEMALSKTRETLPDCDKMNFSFRKNKNGEYTGLIILNKYSKPKTRKVKQSPEVVPEDNNNNNVNDEVSEEVPVETPKRVSRPPLAPRTPRPTIPKNPDRRGAVRREKKTNVENTLKNLANQITVLNQKLLKLKAKQRDRELYKVARENLKAQMKTTKMNPKVQEFDNVFDQMYYANFDNVSPNALSGFSQEDLKELAIKHFH